MEEKENKIKQLKLDTQDVIIEILKDSVEDNKNIIKRLQATIVLLTLLLVGTFVYYEWSFKAFMSQYDYSNEIVTTTKTDTDAKNYGSHSNATNNINVSIPKNTK